MSEEPVNEYLLPSLPPQPLVSPGGNYQYRIEDPADARHRQLIRVLQDIKDLLRSTVDRLQIIETVVRRK